MKKFTVAWTYIANHGVWSLTAESAEAAAQLVMKGFSDDFRLKGKVYVFEGAPDWTNDTRF